MTALLLNRENPRIINKELNYFIILERKKDIIRSKKPLGVEF